MDNRMKKYRPFYVTLVLLSLPQMGFSLPTGAVAGAEVAIQQDQNKMLISTGHKSIIDWSSFNIGEKELVQFSQPSSSSAVLNRDLGGLPSNILGSLTANGQVYLINQSGIIFGENAMINAAAFIASTLDVLNDQFLQGDQLLFEKDMGGEIVHLGKISASLGDVMLIGRHIKGDGAIDAKNGTIGIASGVEVLVQPQASEKIFIRAAREMAQEEGTGIDLKGALSALQVEIKADGNLYQMAIKNGGRMEAMTTAEKDGTIYLVAENGRVDVTGELIARGGEVRVLGDIVQLRENGLIDVSSDTKGGTVLFGGDFQGKNPEIMNATGAWVERGTKIKADALESGDGGKVIIWSDIETKYYGLITAKGGDKGGDGGNVEVSGKIGLQYNGLVDTRAPMGKTGNLLLDPVNVTISTNPNQSEPNIGVLMVDCPFMFGSCFMGSSMNMPFFWKPTATACAMAPNINANSMAGCADVDGCAGLNYTWGICNVTVVTSGLGIPDCGQPGNITVLAAVYPVDPNGTPLQTCNNCLSLIADNDIFVAAQIINPQNAATSGGQIYLQATNSIYIGSSDAGVTPATQFSAVGATNANTFFNAQLGDVQIGNPMGMHATQVGYPFPNAASAHAFGPLIPNFALQGSISIDAHNDISVLAGTNTGNRVYAQVGHGFIEQAPLTSETMSGTTSNATINLSSFNGDLSIIGGKNGFDNYAQIGHGGINVANITNDIDGEIAVECAGVLTVQGGQGATDSSDLLCYAQIGHGGGSDSNVTRAVNSHGINGNIFLGAGVLPLGITVQGGTTTRSWAHVGHGGDNSIITGSVGGPSDITVNTSPSPLGLTVAAGVGTSAWSMIGHGGGATSLPPTQSPPTLANVMQFGASILGDILLTINGPLKVMAVQDPTLVIPAAGSFVQIGHGGLGTIDSSDIAGGVGGSWSGDIHCSVSGATSVTGGNGNLGYAQIGHGGALSSPDGVGTSGGRTTNITVSSQTGSITVSGTTGGAGLLDNGVEVYGQIGHGGFGCIPAANISDGQLGVNSGQLIGSILVSTFNSITLSGGTITAPSGSASVIGQIGHGGGNFTLTRPMGSATPTNIFNLTGDISVTSSSNIVLNAGNNPSAFGGAFIGHGTIGPMGDPQLNTITIMGDLTVAATNGSITLNGGVLGSSFASAVIGHGNGLFFDAHQFFVGGAETITATNGNIVLNGGPANNAPAYITLLSTPLPLGSQLITATGTLPMIGPGTGQVEVLAGSGSGSHAGIFSQGVTSGVPTPAQTISCTRFRALGGSGVQSFAFVDLANNGFSTNITATQSDIVFFNGATSANNAAFLQSSFLNPFTSSGAGVNLTALGDVVLANSIVAVGSNSILISPNSPTTKFGAFKVDTSTHDSTGTQIAPGTYGITLLTGSGPITISPNSPVFNGYGHTIANFQIGDTTDLTLLGSLSLMPATLISTSGNITVDPFQNIFITSSSMGGASTAGFLEIIADNNMSILNSGTTIHGGTGVTLVIDNQDPFPPGTGIGPGMFTMDPGTFITGTAPIKIFTARRGQNSVQGTIDGVPFAPGTIFVPSATEQWGCYFGQPCASTGGNPFTVFYKDNGTPPGPGPGPGPGPTPSPTALVATTTVTQVLLSSVFYYYQQWDNYLYWPLVFNVGYDREMYFAAAQDMDKMKSFFKFLRPYQKSAFFEGILPGMGDQKTASSYDVIADRELALPPQWKVDGMQYNTVVY